MFADVGFAGFGADDFDDMAGFFEAEAGILEFQVFVDFLDEDRDAGEALDLMRARGLRRLVVTSGGTALGIVSVGDIVQGLAEELAQACALLKADDATPGPRGDGG